MADRVRVIAWAEPNQEVLLRDAIAEAGLDLVAVGSTTSGGAAQLARALELEPADDLRLAVQRDDVDLLLLAAPAPLAPAERRLVREIGLRVVSLEPRPMSMTDLLHDPDAATTAEFVPLLRRAPGYLAAAEVLSEFGERRCVNVATGAGPGQGTLFARLFDAMDLLEVLCGPAEVVDATIAAPTPGVPETLADLRGHLTVNVRFGESRCACVSASDAAGSWFRRVTVLGPAGRLHIDDGGYEWIDAGGELIESFAVPAPLTAGQLVGRHVARVLGNLDAAAPPPPDAARLLAVCEAARLSGRTGQGEAPGRLLEMRSLP